MRLDDTSASVVALLDDRIFAVSLQGKYYKGELNQEGEGEVMISEKRDLLDECSNIPETVIE